MFAAIWEYEVRAGCEAQFLALYGGDGAWVALFRGGRVERYAPDGRLDRVVRLPVSLVTNCAFGGPDLTDLYITTASHRLSEAERREQPLAGALFRIRGCGKGRRAHFCGAGTDA